ncbi:MAG: hypothetical protein ABR587_03075 [Candidatus Binatia bacterium]
MDVRETEETGVLDIPVVVYPRAWRVVASALTIFAHGSLVWMLASYLLLGNPPLNPLRQMRWFLGFFAAPEAAAWFISRAFAARARVEGDMLVLERRDTRIEVPLESIAAVEPWRMPAPRGGVSLKLRSGRRFQYGLQLADPVSFAKALVAAGAAPELEAVAKNPLAVLAHAKTAYGRSFLENPILKFVVYSLVPALPVFRLHQYITYGGTFGEYYTYGLKAYLIAFGIWWASFAIYLVLFAATFRAIVEVLALAATAIAPARAFTARKILERTQRVVFYVGIPTWIALRLLV